MAEVGQRGGFALSFDWIPEPAIFAAGLESIGYRIRSFREPLERSVRQVMSPSLRENFDAGGRPPWQELDWKTLAQKAGEGILIRTGLLARVAGQFNIWQVSQESATLGSLPRASYGMIHQYGSGHIPARPWAVIQEEDVDAIQDIFEKWLEERIERWS